MFFTFSFNNQTTIKSTVIEEIDSLELNHEFNSANEAKEFADLLIKNKPIADKYKVMLKTQYGRQPIILYDGTGNKDTGVTTDYILSNS